MRAVHTRTSHQSKLNTPETGLYMKLKIPKLVFYQSKVAFTVYLKSKPILKVNPNTQKKTELKKGQKKNQDVVLLGFLKKLFFLKFFCNQRNVLFNKLNLFQNRYVILFCLHLVERKVVSTPQSTVELLTVLS